MAFFSPPQFIKDRVWQAGAPALPEQILLSLFPRILFSPLFPLLNLIRKLHQLLSLVNVQTALISDKRTPISDILAQSSDKMAQESLKGLWEDGWFDRLTMIGKEEWNEEWKIGRRRRRAGFKPAPTQASDFSAGRSGLKP